MEHVDSSHQAAYGGRRARVLHHLYRAADTLGALHHYRAIEWRRVRRLIMVCKGNICRSPYAEARARLLGLDAISCGLQCDAGGPANAAAIANARARNVDLRPHRTTPLRAVALGPGDLLLTMEPVQARMVAPAASCAGAQVSLLGLWVRPVHPYIHDPYGHASGAFQSCYTIIDAALPGVRHLLGSAHGAAVANPLS